MCQIKDTGVGIPPDKLESIFKMFMQVDPSLERSQSGLGTGLTLVKRLVELHGGVVTAHTEGIGLGSKFLVRLPMMSTPDAEAAEPGCTGGCASDAPDPHRR